MKAESRQITVDAALQEARRYLENVEGESVLMESRLLLGKVLAREKEWLIAYPEAELSVSDALVFRDLLEKRREGVPLPYLLGEWWFYGRRFLVTPDVLIPRPETELLVEHALAWLQSCGHAPKIMDLGTGSGCIAVTLASELPHASLAAVDISDQALRIARSNAERYSATNISFHLSDLFDSVPLVDGGYDLICANLPYIPSQMMASLDVARYEPGFALNGGPEGLHLIRRTIETAPGVLAPGGMLLLEIEETQGPKALKLAERAMNDAEINLFQDLAGKDRLVAITQQGNAVRL